MKRDLPQKVAVLFKYRVHVSAIPNWMDLDFIKIAITYLNIYAFTHFGK